MFYSESHEWVRKDENTYYIGITDFAQKELGDIVYVELPKVGSAIQKGQEVAVLESTKAAADVYSPLSGKITAINEALVDKPEMINIAPESEGWIYAIELSNNEALSELMSHDEYKKMVS